ncbi:phage tail assembly chaperone [Pseudomonas abietaniphila]|uniref:phage tail assembly chaperone n=1 Tax=Pseudomonas abietaniphila TaxID=89065 RepID=UPI00078595B7|nr:phage tail assembly chaperone [Pseudomonas abietaniphila]
MAKISIQQKPTFTADVEIPRIGDKPIKVPFTFAYLDRDQLAEFGDGEITHGKELSEIIKKGDATVRDITTRAEEFEVNQIKMIVKGWGFDDELNDDNIRALVRSASAVPAAILTAYKGAYHKAREGN